MVDFVNHPPHYTAYKGLEIIDLTEQMNFNRGNAVKYIARAGLKGEGLAQEIEDLEKAVWYIQREIKRIASATAEEELEDEPTCDICDIMAGDTDAWCGNCDKCLDHCSCKSSFCPHVKNPSIEHLRYNCQRNQTQVSYDLGLFDTGAAHFIARRNVHLTVDDVMAEVLDMVDVSDTASFVVSTYEVADEG